MKVTKKQLKKQNESLFTLLAKSVDREDRLYAMMDELRLKCDEEWFRRLAREMAIELGNAPIGSFTDLVGIAQNPTCDQSQSDELEEEWILDCRKQSDEYDESILSGTRPTRDQIVSSAVIDLIECGITEINNQPTDVWLLRFLRELISTEQVASSQNPTCDQSQNSESGSDPTSPEPADQSVEDSPQATFDIQKEYEELQKAVLET